MKPLGIRNNNPLNIRFSPMNKWKGQNGCNQGFCTFDSMEHGYRAALILLRNYVKHGYDTISEIISRWAPESENNVKAYINAVLTHFNEYNDTDYRNLTANTQLPKDDPDALLSYLQELAWIMSLVETGYLQRVRFRQRCMHLSDWDDELTQLHNSLVAAVKSLSC